MDPRLADILADQHGVVSRRQALQRGLEPHDLARLLRRKELAGLEPGVYVNHTGKPPSTSGAGGTGCDRCSRTSPQARARYSSTATSTASRDPMDSPALAARSGTGSEPGAVYRDVRYAVGVVIELDGRLFHDNTAQRDRDFDRDLDAAAHGLETRRVSWGQVFERPCWTASRIETLLRRAGWAGRGRPCGPSCQLRAAA